MSTVKTAEERIVEAFSEWLDLSTTPWIVTDLSWQGRILTREEWEAKKVELAAGIKEADEFYAYTPDHYITGINAARLQDDLNQLAESTRQTGKPETLPRNGYVYLLESGDGFYKIGRAIHLKSRTKDIATQMPYKITMAHHFKSADYVEAEAELHARFHDKRANGEWFKLDPADVAYIKSLPDEW